MRYESLNWNTFQVLASKMITVARSAEKRGFFFSAVVFIGRILRITASVVLFFVSYMISSLSCMLLMMFMCTILVAREMGTAVFKRTKQRWISARNRAYEMKKKTKQTTWVHACLCRIILCDVKHFSISNDRPRLSECAEIENERNNNNKQWVCQNGQHGPRRTTFSELRWK